MKLKLAWVHKKAGVSRGEAARCVYARARHGVYHVLRGGGRVGDRGAMLPAFCGG